VTPKAEGIATIEDVVRGFGRLGYVLDTALATAVYLVIRLGKPLLIEGHAGVGKTEVAKVLASLLNTELIRLQCHEGLDVSSAVYEWNYQKQLLAIQLQGRSEQSVEEKVKHIFGPDYLLERPLLRSVRAPQSPVLLVDEVDRSDEAFEAFLLELLSDFQISVPEMGTIRATHRPYVILTSNRTRELSDALKRRCLYHWIDYPSLEKELEIVRLKLPRLDPGLPAQVVRWVQTLRQMDLSKPPGVAETLDCVEALNSLGAEHLDSAAAERTLGCVLKTVEDLGKVRTTGIEKLFPQ
jgi:MoxR-like ATPase